MLYYTGVHAQALGGHLVELILAEKAVYCVNTLRRLLRSTKMKLLLLLFLPLLLPGEISRPNDDFRGLQPGSDRENSGND